MKKYIYILLLLAAIISSCKKDNIQFYEGKPAISLYVNRTEADSSLFNFAFGPANVTKDTVFLKARIQGPVTSYDRQINLGVAEGTNATEGVHFQLPAAVLKTGAVEILYPVILLRTADLKTSLKTLVVAPRANSFFEIGALGQEVGLTYSIPKYKIKFNDFYSEPAYWTSIASQVGVFSIRKMLFMMEVYNREDFILTRNGGTFPIGELYNMKNRLSTALLEYEKLHGPMLDENNNRVTF